MVWRTDGTVRRTQDINIYHHKAEEQINNNLADLTGSLREKNTAN
jgi:hypothetical protein